MSFKISKYDKMYYFIIIIKMLWQCVDCFLYVWMEWTVKAIVGPSNRYQHYEDINTHKRQITSCSFEESIIKLYITTHGWLRDIPWWNVKMMSEEEKLSVMKFSKLELSTSTRTDFSMLSWKLLTSSVGKVTLMMCPSLLYLFIQEAFLSKVTAAQIWFM